MKLITINNNTHSTYNSCDTHDNYDTHTIHDTKYNNEIVMDKIGNYSDGQPFTWRFFRSCIFPPDDKLYFRPVDATNFLVCQIYWRLSHLIWFLLCFVKFSQLNLGFIDFSTIFLFLWISLGLFCMFSFFMLTIPILWTFRLQTFVSYLNMHIISEIQNTCII